VNGHYWYMGLTNNNTADNCKLII